MFPDNLADEKFILKYSHGGRIVFPSGEIQFIILLMLAVVTGGCVSGPVVQYQEKFADSVPWAFSNQGINVTPITGSPYIYITYPPFDGGVESGNVSVTVLVENFTLATPGIGGKVQGEGHIIYYKDVIPPVSPGIPAFTGEGTFQVTNETQATWDGVQQNTHTFSVQLVNNDNTPLLPPVIDAVDVTVYNSLP